MFQRNPMALILEDVLAARARIKPEIHRTPLLHSRRLSEEMGCDLYIKGEHLQKTGSFKVRGVLNFLLTTGAQSKSVTTYSSGNHGQALAWAARLRGMTATVFMPEDASPMKVAAVKGYGAKASFAGMTNQDRETACRQFAEREGALVVPPYDHKRIIAGQGSAMLEVLEDLPRFDVALLPAGGGGLLSGNAFVLNALGRPTQVFSCEPSLAEDLKLSLDAGARKRIDFPNTIADGLRSLSVGDLNWEIIQKTVRAGLTCSETSIGKAMAYYAAWLKQVVEPSGAVSLACLMENRQRFLGKKVVVFVSGGNIALADYAKLVDEHVFE